MKLVLIQVCIFLFAVSCSNNKKIPGNILKPAEMQAVLTDVMMADVFNQERIFKDSGLKQTSENAAYFKKIFQLHSITKAEFEKSFQFYLKRPDLMRVIIDSISSDVNRKNSLLTINTDSIKSKRNGYNIKKITGPAGSRR